MAGPADVADGHLQLSEHRRLGRSGWPVRRSIATPLGIRLTAATDLPRGRYGSGTACSHDVRHMTEEEMQAFILQEMAKQ